MRRAIYPGSFDPITYGHVDLVHRAAQLFDELLVAISDNSSKSPLFTPQERLEMASVSLADEPKVKVTVFRGLLVDYVAEQ
ncbi:MAG: adenylyltransferase/cytidyltransferase family protein, partial [bacterium]